MRTGLRRRQTLLKATTAPKGTRTVIVPIVLVVDLPQLSWLVISGLFRAVQSIVCISLERKG